MRIALTTLNSKYIHTNLALRWIYVARDIAHTTEIFEFVMKDDLNKCTQTLLEFKPDVIGISVYIWNAQQVKVWIGLIKAVMPACRILVGGPEVSYEADDWLAYPIEGILKGEGEKTFWQAVNKQENIDGFLSKNYQSPVTYARSDLAWLETLESPYFLSIDENSRKQRYLYLETARGCPYQCAYCLSSSDNQVRMFSTAYVSQQLTYLNKFEVKQVKFLDRTFNVHPQRALEIANMIQSLQITTSFQLEIVAESLSAELLAYFSNPENNKNYRFEVGVQSFNNEALLAVKRYQDNDKLSAIIRSMNEWGCILHVDLIAGLPYEDIVSFENSFNQLFALHAKEIQVGILKLLKGTSLRLHAQKYEIKYESEAPYTVVSTKWMSESDLKRVEEVYHGCEKFYNSGKCRKSIDTLIALKKVESPFKLMQKLGQLLALLPAPYQIRDLFLCFYEAFSKVLDAQELEGYLLVDYYALFKQRPKRLFETRVSDQQKKTIFAWLIQTKQFDEQTLFNYANIEYGYRMGEKIYQCIIYDQFQNQPRRYWLDMTELKIGSLED